MWALKSLSRLGSCSHTHWRRNDSIAVRVSPCVRLFLKLHLGRSAIAELDPPRKQVLALQPPDGDWTETRDIDDFVSLVRQPNHGLNRHLLGLRPLKKMSLDQFAFLMSRNNPS